MIIFIYLIFLILLIELFLLINIKFLQKKIPWIVTKEDEYPIFDKFKLIKFFDKTYDPLLGWNWKPFSKHQEKINNKNNNIFFGKFGERKLKKIKKNNYKYASFGDSFVFCRYVKNDKTWQSYLTEYSKQNGLNFGVGNFGLDQVYIKYLRTNIPKNIKTVYIGFVPETLSRCKCLWKHYLEFNNIYAFKPKFILKNKKLFLIKNPIKSPYSFKNIKLIINSIKYKEFFYKENFLKYKFSFPYLISFIKNFNYNLYLFFFSFQKILGINENAIWDFIINKNCKRNDELYLDNYNKEFIYQLLLSFLKQSKIKKQKIVFLLFPQKYDLSLKEKNYKKFFLEMKNKFDIIDFTDVFKKEDLDKIYLPAKYGGHLTPYGNKLVAKTILKQA